MPVHHHEHGGRSSAELVDIPKTISLLARPGQSLLDIGCGPGDYLTEAKKQGIAAIGLDIHGPSLAAARGRGCEVIEADATEKVPLPTASQETILLANVLHGFVANGQAQQAFREIRRVLKTNGTLGIVEFYKTDEPGPPRSVRLTVAGVKLLAGRNGFTPGTTTRVGAHNYLVLLQKNARPTLRAASKRKSPPRRSSRRPANQ
ncbi:hypothetical protein AUJ68_00820 [Candidatus Woesearchaeota archaeon CG1_02_57_44]|nr:MAG: hypothetical protein AUJ68_00820 [Candidatus Woesearchaeota archaeon CG1_02_57_44]